MTIAAPHCNCDSPTASPPGRGGVQVLSTEEAAKELDKAIAWCHQHVHPGLPAVKGADVASTLANLAGGLFLCRPGDARCRGDSHGERCCRVAGHDGPCRPPSDPEGCYCEHDNPCDGSCGDAVSGPERSESGAEASQEALGVAGAERAMRTVQAAHESVATPAPLVPVDEPEKRS